MENDLVASKTKSKEKKNEKKRPVGIGAGPILEDEFKNYKIRAGQLNGEFVARAFPKHSAKSQGLMAEAKGASEAEAIDTLKSLLTERETNRTAARRWEERASLTVPTNEEFLESLQQTSLSAAQKSMLKALALGGEDGLVALSIMNAGGYKSRDAAIKALAKAGILIADFIGLELPESEEKDAEPVLGVLGYRGDTEEDAPLHLILHQELREAVRQMF